MARINFFETGIASRLKEKRKLKQFLEQLFIGEQKTLEQLDIVFCTDEYLHNINLQYLAHDTYTDIITFDLSEPGSGTIGEIYISLDRVKENAASLQLPVRSELLRVIFHGALHLCGYKDKTKSEITIMRAKEDAYLRLYEQS